MESFDIGETMFNLEFLQEWWEFFVIIIVPAIFATIRIITATMIFSSILGFILAILLTMYSPTGLNPKKKVYDILDFIVNIVRSFPILILIVALMPFTRLIIGTTVGEKAIILPMTIASTCFIGRALENTFKGVNSQLIEAARSFGASDIQIMIRVIVKESVPSMISLLSMGTINNISNSTIAGTVGGGGIGAIAINYGYQSFNDAVLYTSVIILFIMVQVVQHSGNKLYNKSMK